MIPQGQERENWIETILVTFDVQYQRNYQNGFRYGEITRDALIEYYSLRDETKTNEYYFNLLCELRGPWILKNPFHARTLLELIERFSRPGE